MVCGNCGNQVPDGVKFCPKCGSPAKRAATPDIGGYAPSNNYNGGTYARPAASNGGKQLWLAVMAVIAMLGILSVVCSSLSGGYDGQTSSVPFIAVAHILGSLSKLANDASGIMSMTGLPVDELASVGSAFTGAMIGMIFYTIFAVICIILYTISVVFTLKRKSLGIVAGIAAGVLALILSIIMIVASFVFGSKFSFPGMSIYPSVWTWLAIPISILYAVFCFVKSRELLSM